MYLYLKKSLFLIKTYNLHRNFTLKIFPKYLRSTPGQTQNILTRPYLAWPAGSYQVRPRVSKILNCLTRSGQRSGKNSPDLTWPDLRQHYLRLLTDETLLKKFSDYLSANGATISFQYTARHNLDEEEQLTDNVMFSLNLK